MMTRKVFYRLLPTFVLAVLLWAGCSGARETTREAALPPQARDSSVVAILDGEPITVSEIERRYRRSLGGNSSAVPDSAELRDFLDRYLNFRLKVKAAEDAGIGDLPEIQEEIDTYRLQLARPYMLEQEVLEPIIREVYTRSQDMVDASHILIR
ncbi:MAG: peptidylprolyl isomerase, partial [Bacteroidetes bacterium]